MLLYNSIRGLDHYPRVSKQKKVEFDRLVLSPPPSSSIGVGICKRLPEGTADITSIHGISTSLPHTDIQCIDCYYNNNKIHGKYIHL